MDFEKTIDREVWEKEAKDAMIRKILDRRRSSCLPEMGEIVDDKVYKEWLGLNRPDITYAEFCACYKK